MKVYELRTYSWSDYRVDVSDAIDIALQDSRLFTNMDEAQAEALSEFDDYLEAIGETDADEPELLPSDITLEWERAKDNPSECWTAWENGDTGWKAVVYVKEV